MTATNKKGKVDLNMAKKVLDEDFTVQQIGLPISLAIQQARDKEKMTQVQLAKAINEKVTVVEDYESGRAIPDNKILAAMEKVLKTKLPRQPKEKGKKKKMKLEDFD